MAIESSDSDTAHAWYLLDQRRRIGANFAAKLRTEQIYKYLRLRKNLPAEIAGMICKEYLADAKSCKHIFKECNVCHRSRCALCLMGWCTSGQMARSCACPGPTRRSRRQLTRKLEGRSDGMFVNTSGFMSTSALHAEYASLYEGGE